MLEIFEYISDIPVLMDVVTVNISALLGLDVLDSHSLLPDYGTIRLWTRIIISQNSLQLINEWSVQMNRASDHTYVPLNAPYIHFIQWRNCEKSINNSLIQQLRSYMSY